MCIMEDDLVERRTRKASSEAQCTNHSVNSMCFIREIIEVITVLSNSSHFHLAGDFAKKYQTEYYSACCESG